MKNSMNMFIRNLCKISAFLLLVFCTILPLSASCYQNVQANHSSLATNTKTLPQEVKVGFLLLSGGKLDFNTSSLDMDFYVWLNYSGKITPTFEFLNSKDYKITELKKKIPYPGTNINYIFYRVNGTFEQDLSLKNYPFDQITLRVLMEDTRETSDKLIYLPDLANSGLDPLFNISGWEIRSTEFKTKKHEYATNFGVPTVHNHRQNYSQIEITTNISRNVVITLIKVVGPAILFLLIGSIGVFLPSKQLIVKMNLCVASLFSSVAYHLAIFQNLPHINYLTFADKMMLGNYFIILCNMTFVIAIFLVRKSGSINLQKKLTKIAKVVVLLLTLVFICWLVLNGLIETHYG